MKANGTRWGWQIPVFGTSELQIRWNGGNMKNKVTLILIFTAFIALCFSCNRSNEQIVVINDTEDTIATKAPQTLTYDFRKDAIIALYMLGCNDRLEMGKTILINKQNREPK